MKTTKNWCYGAKTPDIEQAVSDAIFAAHQYRNTLCRLEHDKRKRHEELLLRLAPKYVEACAAVAAAEATLTEIREAIQAERMKQRTKAPKGVDLLKTRAATMKAQLKELRANRKQAKQDAYATPAVIAAMDQNSALHKDAIKQAKAASGLYWGTEASVKMACASFASGAPPRFKRYQGEGQLAIQLQGGLDTADAMRGNTLCYLDHVEGKHADCLIRIGSEGRSPIFARVPIIFHRPLPPGKIKWAYLERRKIASHVRWTIRLTIDCEVDTDRCLPGEVAVHTGWVMESSGLRVATWLGSDGRQGVLRLPKSHCEDYLKVDQIRKARDTRFNEMIATLRAWLKDRDVPEWVAEVRPHLHAWKAPARLSKLVWQWKENRIDGDEDLFAELEFWRKTDKHRWQNERRLSVRITRRRKDVYRNFAATLAGQYGVLYVSPIDAKALTENSEPEDLERDNTQSHRHAKWAAVSDLTQCLREKFPLHTIDVSSVNISRQCHNCCEVHQHEITSRKIQCHECGKTVDVDENAVINTLARGEAAKRSGALIELVASYEDKVAKSKEKLLKMQEANRAARKRNLEASK